MQAGPVALGTVSEEASQARQQEGQQGVQAKGGLSAVGESVSAECLWGKQHWPWVLGRDKGVPLSGCGQDQTRNTQRNSSRGAGNMARGLKPLTHKQKDLIPDPK